jgi:hypothetical protein
VDLKDREGGGGVTAGIVGASHRLVDMAYFSVLLVGEKRRCVGWEYWNDETVVF